MRGAQLKAVAGEPKEVYVSTDIEADGPIPGPYSMRSLGSAAFSTDGKLLDTFAANLEPLPDAGTHPDTMSWWRRRPRAWQAAQQDAQPPAKVMHEYAAWLKKLPAAPVFVGYPASYDFLFVYWYLIRFVGESPFSFSGIDLKTFAMVLLGGSYRQTTKRNMPRRWFGPTRHRNEALADAIEQGELFCNMLAESRSRE